MIKFKSGLKGIRVNTKGYTKALDAQMKLQMHEAARAWLVGTASQVPVWSGMAKGSLLPLARFLKVNFPINPITTSRIDAGASLGWFYFNTANFEYTFSFTTEVPNYLINEFNANALPSLRHPTPWLSMQAGADAWNNYMDTNLFNKVPQITRYVSFVDIK
jgi:hypothetical protein